jgi:O-antigen ligase
VSVVAAERASAGVVSWTKAVAAIVLASCVVVPCVFTTRLDAVFVVPKLTWLWAAAVVALAVAAAGLAGGAPFLARPVQPIDAALAVFLLLNVAAWLFSADREQSLYGERLHYQGLLTVLLYAAFFCLARVTLADLRALMTAVATGATLVSSYALVQRAGLDPVWDGYLPSGRVFSSIGQPNALAAYLVLALPLTLPLLRGAKGLRGAAVAVALATMAAALLLTSSRGGLLGLIAVVVVLLAGTRPGRSAVVGVVVATAAAMAVLAIAQPERLTSSWDVSGEGSARVHLDLWTVGAHMALERPVLGGGQETFPDRFPAYSHDVLPPDRAASLDAFRVESPHNGYLGIAAGAGVPALAAYLGIVAAFAWAAITAARRASAEFRLAFVCVLAAVAGHLVTDFFMTPDLTSTWLFWVVLGAGTALAQSSRLARTKSVESRSRRRGRSSRARASSAGNTAP